VTIDKKADVKFLAQKWANIYIYIYIKEKRKKKKKKRKNIVNLISSLMLGYFLLLLLGLDWDSPKTGPLAVHDAPRD
jgi:hypothetical protein